MNKPKVVRDVIIIVVIIAIAGFLYLNRSKGPVQPDDETGNGDPSQIDHGEMGMMHGGSLPEMTEGEPVITLGDSYVGSDWFDANVGMYEIRLTGQGFEEEPAAGEIEERETWFYGQFETENAAQELLDEMDITIGQLRKMWMEELIETALISKIAVLNELDPESEEAQTTYDGWIWERMMDSDFIFADPEHEEYFSEIVTQYLETPVDGEAIEDPHGAHDFEENHGAQPESTESVEDSTGE
jgi:hypothetical protein